MSEKFQGKYRIPSARLKNWDYGSNAPYFITICTKNREHYFGSIENGIMEMTEIGQIAEKFWYEIPQHFQFAILDAFVVMPNHVHGIIIINKQSTDGDIIVVETPKLGVSTTTETPCPSPTASIIHDKNNDPSPTTTGGKNPKWKPGILGVILNQYKRICTLDARRINPDFIWQSRYYDHVIRDASSFERIHNYIVNNPANWRDDKFFNQQ